MRENMATTQKIISFITLLLICLALIGCLYFKFKDKDYFFKILVVSITFINAVFAVWRVILIYWFNFKQP
ncbi:hypothetical protein PSOLA_00530 [Candidatus Phytoplasma solani]